jgi:alpha/beta superfamily hydrolase
MTEAVTVRSTDDLAIEAELDLPKEPRGAVVLCHPHPRMGGTMNAPLLLELRDEFMRRNFGVVRFNFRGIGASQGTSGTGIAEVSDAAGAVTVARDRFEGRPVAIAGWSFGAAVAVRAASQDPELAACVAIAPAVDPRPNVTDGLPHPADIALEMPVLVVCGSNDHLVDSAEARRWAESIRDGRFVEITGANHFFWAKYEALNRVVGDFLEAVV